MKPSDTPRAALTRREAIGLLAAVPVLAQIAPTSALAAGELPSLTLAVGVEPVGMDAGRIAGGGDYIFFGNVFEGLYTHGVDGKLAPALAESSQLSADGLVLDVRLRAGVTFHNGDEFTADDVRFSWQRGVDPEMRNPRASVILNNIKDVEVVDKLNCRIHLKQPDASFLDNADQYWYIVPKAYITKVGDDVFSKQPIGTGPFSFVEYQIRSHIKLKGYPKHWRQAPAVSDVLMKIVPDEQARVVQLQSGEADIITAVPPLLAPMLERMPKVKIASVPTFENIAIAINCAYSANPDMQKAKVRQAMNYAVDRQTLLKSIMRGYAMLEGPPCADGVEGCSPDLVPPPYPYDPDKARALLKEANFDFSRPLNFVGLAPGRTPQSKETGEAVVAMLSKVGIKANMTALDYGAWLAMYGAKKKDPKVDIFFSTLTDYNPDPGGRITRLFRTGSTFSWYSNPDLDAKLDRINLFTSTDERRKFLAGIFKEIYEDAPQIFLWANNANYGMSDRIDWQPSHNVSWPLLWNVKKKA